MFEPDRVLSSLASALRSIRADRRLSQEELSLRTGVHRNYIGGIERAERNPTITTVASLAYALDVSLAEVFALADQLADQSAG